jgi:zinc protease
MLYVETLPGGATLLIDPTGPVPVAACYLWFNVGSAWEGPGLEGAAHLLEHMLFKGTGELGPGEITARLEAVGGDLNAWTSVEETVFHCTIPSAQVLLALDTLVGMGLNPRLDGRELRREKGVVVEEIRGAKDDPGGQLTDALRARAWGQHPYGRPILGTEASVKGIRREALVAFHQAHYIASNAVLVVTGPVDQAAVIAFARERLSGGPVAPPRPVRPARPEVVEDPILHLDPGFDERIVEVLFPIPDLGHDEIAALDLLASGLSDGAAAILPAVLRHERDLVHSTWAELEVEVDGGLLAVGATARDGKLEETVEVLFASLARVAREGLPAAALRRARTSILGDRVRETETVDGRAHRLAWYQVWFKDPRADARYDAAIQRTTAEAVRAAAARYLDRSRAVLGALSPKAELDQERLARAADRGWSTPSAPLVARAGLFRRRLSCGATVVCEPDERGDLASVSVVGIGGGLVEGSGNAGLSGAWSALLSRGAGDLDAMSFAAAVEDRSGSLRPWAGRNSAGIQIVFPSGDVQLGVELLAEALLSPRFDPLEVERTRADLVAGQRATRDDPSALAWDLAFSALYPGHPWGHPGSGTAASAARLSPARLRAFHRRVVQGENLVFGLAGGVDPEELCRRLEHLLRGLAPGAAQVARPPTPPARFQRRRSATVPRAEAVAQVLVAFPSVGVEHPDEPVLSVLSALLGGAVGGGGRLFDRIREKHGLAYDVSAHPERGLGGGALVFSVITDPDRVEEAKRALWVELDRVVAEPVAPAELERVKAGLVEGAVLGLQRAASRADHVATAERYGGGADRWRERLLAPRAVTASQLQAFAAETLRRDRCVRVETGPDRSAKVRPKGKRRSPAPR